MKHALSLILLLWAFSLNAQTSCQSIISNIQSTIPEAVDGYLDLCLGESLIVNGAGIYPENNTNYFQSDATSTFTWSFGNGDIAEGQSVTYTFEEAGLYFTRLQIIDVMGCKNDSSELLKVRVAPLPHVEIASFPNTEICEGTNVELSVDLPSVQTFYPTESIGNEDPIPIPDGTGEFISDTLLIPGFGNSFLVSPDDIEVCVNMEHSWLRDLEIKLTCPNGRSAILHDFAGQLGGEVFLGEPIENDEGLPSPIPGIGFDYCWNNQPEVETTWIEYANQTIVEVLPAGSYRSFDALDSLVGCPIDGEWVLSVVDLWAIDNGFLLSWNVNFSGQTTNSEMDSFMVETSAVGWVPDATLIELSSTEALVAPVLDTTIYTISATNNFGCESETNVELTIVQNPNPSQCLPCDDAEVFAGDDQNLNCFNNTVLEAQLFNIQGEITWSTIDGAILTDTMAPAIEVDSPGSYVLTVFNPFNGCEVSDTVEILPIVLPTVLASVSTPLDCFTDTIQLSGIGSFEGPGVEYSWAAYAGGVVVSGVNTLTPLAISSGNYILEVFDSNSSCFNWDTINVEIPDPLFAGVITIPASCDQSDGSAEIIPITNPSQLTVSWSNGDTGLQTNGLAQGWYSVTVTGNGCTLERQFFLDEDLSCKVRIGGYVLNDDENLDCETDSTTIGTECIMLRLLPDDIYTYTDSTGYYEFVRDAGSYTVEYIEEDIYELLCPDTGSHLVNLPNDGSVSLESNFYIERLPIVNWCTSHSMGPARPGFEVNFNISPCNLGDLTEDAVLTFTHDSLLNDVNLFEIADEYDEDTQTATWYLNGQLPQDCELFSFSLYLPPNVMLGTELSFSMDVQPTMGDDDFPYNNSLDWTRTVVGSYDPNDKSTFTGENQFGGNILEGDSVIHYHIRFQNTGTDTAFTVVVRDTLSEHLDVTTIRPGIVSHDYQLQFEGNNVLVFFFDNILLPDSTTNEPASNGFVSFSINKKRNLPIGTEIRNRAAIFFDFNAPIITNETVHILTEPTTGVFESSIFETELTISPNPNSGRFLVAWELDESKVASLEIWDTNGRLMQSMNLGKSQLQGKYSHAFSISQRGQFYVIMREENGKILGVEVVVVE